MATDINFPTYMKNEDYNILYMAPELFISKNVTQAMDIWGVGIIMYELLKYGKHPYFSDSITKQDIIQIMTTPDALFNEVQLEWH